MCSQKKNWKLQKKTFQNRSGGMCTQRGPEMCVCCQKFSSREVSNQMPDCPLWACVISRNTACLALLVTSYGENQDCNFNESWDFCGWESQEKNVADRGGGTLLGMLPCGGPLLPLKGPLPDPSCSELLFSSLQAIVFLPLKPQSACWSSSQSHL